MALLTRLDAGLFRQVSPPLHGRKLHVHVRLDRNGDSRPAAIARWSSLPAAIVVLPNQHPARRVARHRGRADRRRIEPKRPHRLPHTPLSWRHPECYIVPGFVDVHMHGVDGHDTLDEGNPLEQIASRLPRVTG